MLSINTALTVLIKLPATVQALLYDPSEPVHPKRGQLLRRIHVATLEGERSNTRQIFAGLIAALTLVIALLCFHALDATSSANDSSDAPAASMAIMIPQVDDNPAADDGLIGCAVAGLACTVGLFGLLLGRLTGTGVRPDGAGQKAPPQLAPAGATRVVPAARPSLHSLGILRT